MASRVAVVTGAGRGIGRQVSLDLSAEGAHVIACARTTADLESLAEDASGPGSVVPFTADIAEPGAAAAAVAAAVDRFGRLDVVVNNAGGATAARLEHMTDERWRAGFEVDFFAAANLSVAAVEPMRAAGWGRIVNVASTYAREPDPAFAAYGAAKAALVNLTKSFARAYSAQGVCTNCVLPGVVLTEGTIANAERAAARTGSTVESVLDQTMGNDPVAAGRFGEPREVSAAICFLASEAASWITGACLAVDGGTLRVAP